MPDFILTYHGGKRPETKEEGLEQMTKWNAWVTSLADAWVNPGSPVGKTIVLTAHGMSDASIHPMNGFLTLSPDSLDAAVKMIANCPVLDYGGTLEISEMMQMPS